MRVVVLAAAAIAAGMVGVSAAWAADNRTMDAGMAMGPMSMGVPMAPMPSVYGGDADKPGAPLFKGLGDHHHPISSHNPQTQLYFDQGVNLLYGFNHAEAIRSFREAARLDPDCAMCWWGMAFALGPNINLPMQDDAVTPAWQALGHARALEPKASPEERDWIEALAVRYSADPKADRHALDEAFAQAMGKLWAAHPDDLDAGVFYAEAMMDTQPWDYWQADGVTPKGHATEIVSVLEGIIKRAPDHPGALHLYIHAVEATTTPERAEAAADRLETLMPGAGHVVHMPSHIYYRVGRYEDAVKVNELAATVDEAYIAACKAQGFYPVGYYGHNIHFLWTSSEMQGRYAAAIGAARRLVKAVDVANLGETMAPVELYGFTPVATLLRFGKWDEVLAEPPPPANLHLDTAIWLYARGYAHANKGDLAAAHADRDKLSQLVSADYSKFDAFGIPARQMVDLSQALLDAEIARKSGDIDKAVTLFKAAAVIEHSLNYTEPPYWHQPVSHLLGAALLDAHRPAEAEAIYRESLKTYRVDGWALFGLAQALQAQGEHDEAAKVMADQKRAWAFADVTLTSSRF
ncbi:MAG TPA: tetratricopeptide repeat protein [Caulobacteraceae bacterium]|nr:tetratricopeptide repeat protein [Caulobacteraceae bacterium]